MIAWTATLWKCMPYSSTDNSAILQVCSARYVCRGFIIPLSLTSLHHSIMWEWVSGKKSEFQTMKVVLAHNMHSVFHTKGSCNSSTQSFSLNRLQISSNEMREIAPLGASAPTTMISVLRNQHPCSLDRRSFVIGWAKNSSRQVQVILLSTIPGAKGHSISRIPFALLNHDMYGANGSSYYTTE